MSTLKPIALLLAGLVIACKPAAEMSLAEVADKIDFARMPRLPSPDSGTYYASPEPSRDPVISALVRGKAHDGALASAAAGLALSIADDRGTLSRWELREALWRGGWPYNAFDARSWIAADGRPPPSDLLKWLEGIPEDQAMALIRARGRAEDIWVGIRANPLAQLEPIPRRTHMGSVINLPAIPGASFRLSDGGGELTEGRLETGATLLLTTAGEWLLQVVADRREIARMPIYVEIEPPREPVLQTEEKAPLISSAVDAEGWTRKLLTHVRRVYGLEPWLATPLLDSAAQRLAEGEVESPMEAARAVGMVSTSVVRWTCDDITVENCLDYWLWDPRRRAAMLSSELDTYGIHASLDARGLHITMLLADVE